MDDTPKPPPETITPANDAPPIDAAFDALVMTFARLLGRQMAREQFYAALEAANAPAANAPSHDDET